MRRHAVWPWVNVIAVVGTLAVNIAANALPINGQNTGAISDRFQVFFVPAGYVFAIWGVIYVGLIAFAVYQALPAQRNDERLAGVDALFLVSCLANTTWIFLWHYEQFALSVVVMLVLLVSLIGIYLRLDIGRRSVSALVLWLAHMPFSIYLGWITVATVANITDLLDYWQWGALGISGEIWAVVMIIVALLLGWAIAWTRGDVAYVLVLIWSFVGIAIKQSGAPLVSSAAWLAALLAVTAAAYASTRRRQLVG